MLSLFVLNHTPLAGTEYGQFIYGIKGKFLSYLI